MAKIYILPPSVNCHGAQVLMEENKQWFSSFTTVSLDFLAGDTKKPEFTAVNPWQTTPTIQEGDLNLWESTAVLRYLCNSRKPVLEKWYPSDPAKRAKIDEFLDFRQSSYIEVQSAYCNPALFGFPMKAGAKQNLMDLLNDIARFYLQDGKFVCGFDNPTIADLSFGCSLAAIAVHKDFALPTAVAAYKDRLAKACPSWEKIRAPLDGFISYVHGKQAEAKEHVDGTLYMSYGTRGSKVLWLANTLGAKFKIHKLELSKGENRSAEYLKKNPNGGVPTLELANGDVIYESAAIVQYLLEKYDPSNALTGPVGSKARNQYLVWNASSNEIEECIINYFLNTFLYGDRGDKALAKTSKENFDGHYKGILEKVIAGAGAGNYANGTQNFSALDIILGYSLNIAGRSGLLKGSAALEAYVTKIQAHPHFGPAHADK